MMPPRSRSTACRRLTSTSLTGIPASSAGSPKPRGHSSRTGRQRAVHRPLPASGSRPRGRRGSGSSRDHPWRCTRIRSPHRCWRSSRQNGFCGRPRRHTETTIPRHPSVPVRCAPADPARHRGSGHRRHGSGRGCHAPKRLVRRSPAPPRRSGRPEANAHGCAAPSTRVVSTKRHLQFDGALLCPVQTQAAAPLPGLVTRPQLDRARPPIHAKSAELRLGVVLCGRLKIVMGGIVDQLDLVGSRRQQDTLTEAANFACGYSGFPHQNPIRPALRGLPVRGNVDGGVHVRDAPGSYIRTSRNQPVFCRILHCPWHKAPASCR